MCDESVLSDTIKILSPLWTIFRTFTLEQADVKKKNQMNDAYVRNHDANAESFESHWFRKLDIAPNHLCDPVRVCMRTCLQLPSEGCARSKK